MIIIGSRVYSTLDSKFLAMASSQANLEKMQLRQNYRNLWHTDLMGTIQADTPCKHKITLSLFLSVLIFRSFLILILSAELDSVQIVASPCGGK